MFYIPIKMHLFSKHYFLYF